MLTNPPFYSSTQDLLTSAANKSRPPNSACTGAPVEMITPGGETTFVTRIIDESALPRNRSKILWFSSMLGKFSSVGVVLGVLREKGCTNYAVEEFVQGRQTRRWCVAWSWAGMRPAVSIARGIERERARERERERERGEENDAAAAAAAAAGGSISATVEKKLLPFPSEYEIDLSRDQLHASGYITTTSATAPSADDAALNALTTYLNTQISSLDLHWTFSPSTRTGIGKSPHGDVWSRKARRRKEQQAQQQQQQQQRHQEQQRRYQQRQRGQQIPQGQRVKADGIARDQEMTDITAEYRDVGLGDDDDGNYNADRGGNADNGDEGADKYEDEDDSESESETVYKDIPLAFRIMLRPSVVASLTQANRQRQYGTGEKGSTGYIVHVRWLQGHDVVLFESFCGWLRRKLEMGLK